MKHLFNEYVQSLETYIMFQIKQETQRLTPELIAKNRAPIALDMGAPVQAPPQFVIDKLKEILDEPGIHTYSSPKGEMYYLEAIAQRMKSRFGVELDPKTEIHSLIGSKEGIANLIRELINPTTVHAEKEIILIPDPGYASYKEMLKVSGGKAFPMAMTQENNYMPDLEEVMSEFKKAGLNENKIKALVINYPNNPLGATTTKEYLKKVVDFCKERNILLISDAAYVDMYFIGQEKAPSVLEIEGAKDVAVEFHSFSKPYAMTGWRLGWVCGNSEVIGMFGKLKSTLDTGIFKPLQKAAAMVLNSKEGDEYIKETVLEFEKKQKIMIQGLKELGWDMDNLNIPQATFYLWLPVPPRYKTAKEFTDDVLRTSGVVFVPGNGFGEYGEGFFRISIVVTEEQLYEVIRRLKEDGFNF